MKWYILKNYKPYWNNNSRSIPYLHIEDIVKKQPNTYRWDEIKNPAINWEFPMFKATLSSNQADTPYYLKASDGKNNFYFYFENIDNVLSEYKKEFQYNITYALDLYMTIYFNKLHILLNNHVMVKHIQKFTNRVETHKDDAGVVNAILDIQEHKEYGNTLPITNAQMVRKFIYGTNEDQLWLDNFLNKVDIPVNVDFKLFNDNTQIASVPWEQFHTPNKNGRYTYIVAKSSALQSGKVSQAYEHFKSHAKNTKILIPIFNQPDDQMQGLLNFDIAIQQDNLVNALSSDNFIGMFECDIPFSMWYGESKLHPEIELKFGKNKISTTEEHWVYFIEMPTNYAPKWTIINYADYNNGLEGKIKNLLMNLDKWNEDTEPTLLNPAYYQERCYIDNGKFISTDTSLIRYQVNSNSNNGLSLKAYVLFDSGINIAYDYDEYNNTLSPLWNNKYSNLRSDISTNIGVYGSASATYYANNANSMITSIDVLRNENTERWVDYGMNQASKASRDIATLINPINWLKPKTWSSLFGDITGGVNKGVQAHYEQQNANERLASQINNLATSANTLLSNPYVDAGIPNYQVGDDRLFMTYSNEVHPWDKAQIFRYILNNGVPYNRVEMINTFINRLYMNILHCNTEFNTDNIIQVLNEQDRTVWKGLSFNYQFLSWLGECHKMYNTLDIINVTEPTQPAYIDNVEREIDIITLKEPIEKYITNTNIPYFTEKKVWNLVKEVNPNVPEDLWADVVINWTNNTILISTKDTSTKYYGDVLINSVKLPNTWTATTYYNNDITDFSTDLMRWQTTEGRHGYSISITNNQDLVSNIYKCGDIELPFNTDLTKYYDNVATIKVITNNSTSGDVVMETYPYIPINEFINGRTYIANLMPDNILYFWGEYRDVLAYGTSNVNIVRAVKSSETTGFNDPNKANINSIEFYWDNHRIKMRYPNIKTDYYPYIHWNSSSAYTTEKRGGSHKVLGEISFS